MYSKELMLGDWVYVPHNGSATHYARVIGIYSRDVVSTELDKMSGLIKADALEPIPITPEILEKNGFTYRKSDGSFGLPTNISYGNWDVDVVLFNVTDEYRNNQLHIATPDDSITLLHLMECNHIHELQHALRLCGIEKEITI